MRRDLDLCRALLLELEADPNLIGLKNYQVGSFTDEEISYHVKLLYEAGLIEARDVSAMNSFKWHPLRLTWQGHEFLDAARDDTRWNMAKDIVKDKTGALSFEVIKDVLLKLVAAATSGL